MLGLACGGLAFSLVFVVPFALAPAPTTSLGLGSFFSLLLAALGLLALCPARLFFFLVHARCVPISASATSALAFSISDTTFCLSIAVVTPFLLSSATATSVFVALSIACLSGLASRGIIIVYMFTLSLNLIIGALASSRPRLALSLGALRRRSHVHRVLARLGRLGRISHLSVRLRGLASLSSSFFNFRAREFGRLRSELDARLFCLLVTIATPLAGAFLATVTAPATCSRLALKLAPLSLGFYADFVFLLAALLFFIVLGGCYVCILLKLLLWEQEIDLHYFVGAKEGILAVHAHHLVEGFGLLFVVDVEKNAQLVLARARAVDYRAHVDVLGVEGLQEVMQDDSVVAAVEVLLVRGVGPVLVEQVNFEVEWAHLELDGLAEELGVILVVQTVIRVWVDGFLVKPLVWLSVVVAPLLIAALVAVASAVAIATVPASEVAVAIVVAGSLAAIATVIVATIVVLSGTTVVVPRAIAVVSVAATIVVVAAATVVVSAPIAISLVARVVVHRLVIVARVILKPLLKVASVSVVMTRSGARAWSGAVFSGAGVLRGL